jgi:hypothetical protein
VGRPLKLALAPDQQGQGIGLSRLGTLEATAPPQVRRSQLAAGHKSCENLAMYERRCFREVSGRVDAARVELVVMGMDRA